MSQRLKDGTFSSVHLEFDLPTQQNARPPRSSPLLRVADPTVELGTHPYLRRHEDQGRRRLPSIGARLSKKAHRLNAAKYEKLRERRPERRLSRSEARSLIFSQSLGWIVAALLFGGIVNLMSRPAMTSVPVPSSIFQHR